MSGPRPKPGPSFDRRDADRARGKCWAIAKGLIGRRGEDGRPYGGCYVNATVRLWAQDGVKNPKWGKRVNAQLRAVQFWAEGEPFGESSVDAADEFDEGEDEAPASADDLL